VRADLFQHLLKSQFHMLPFYGKHRTRVCAVLCLIRTQGPVDLFLRVVSVRVKQA
jgi:hypothetical protein